MIEATGYQLKASELMDELVAHGYGEMRFVVTSLKDKTARVDICCGKTWVFFIEKKINFDQGII